MAKVVKRKNYTNDQANYSDEYTIAYAQDDNGVFTIWAEERPDDPYRDKDEAHVDLKGELVCVQKGQEPRSLERAEAVAHKWMLGYSVYIRTGKFPKGNNYIRT